jgi:hypothetical protein
VSEPSGRIHAHSCKRGVLVSRPAGIKPLVQRRRSRSFIE